MTARWTGSLVVRVDPGDHVRTLTNGQCLLRIGDECRRLGTAQHQELLFDRGAAPSDSTAVPDLTTYCNIDVAVGPGLSHRRAHYLGQTAADGHRHRGGAPQAGWRSGRRLSTRGREGTNPGGTTRRGGRGPSQHAGDPYRPRVHQGRTNSPSAHVGKSPRELFATYCDQVGIDDARVAALFDDLYDESTR